MLTLWSLGEPEVQGQDGSIYEKLSNGLRSSY